MIERAAAAGQPADAAATAAAAEGEGDAAAGDVAAGKAEGDAAAGEEAQEEPPPGAFHPGVVCAETEALIVGWRYARPASGEERRAAREA